MSQIHINISPDHMRATVMLVAPESAEPPVSHERLRELLAENGIIYGIDQSGIDQIVANQFLPDQPPVLVARGTAPLDGTDARLEHLVNMEFTHAPRLGPCGRADYYSLHLFENVVADQELARIIPATPGIPGCTVYGQPLPARLGEPLTMQLGGNIERASHDPLVLRTAVSGHAYLHEDSIVVEKVLTIDEHVDFNTGNIDFGGDVEIAGDVKAGFSVRAQGSVLVRGTVEDALIEAGKSVVIQGGFIGKGNGRIRAGQDVIVRHVRNQVIMARNNILVAGESLDATLLCGNEMFVEIRKSWIVGGHAIARNCVRTYALGSKAHAPTRIAVGAELFVKKMLEQLTIEIQALTLELEQLQNPDPNMSTTQSQPARSEQSCREALERKTALRDKYQAQNLTPPGEPKGSISVYDKVYPGVALHIGASAMHVENEFKRTHFTVENGRVVARLWSGDSLQKALLRRKV